MSIERILQAAIERGASDIHIKSDDVVRVRLDGRLVPLTAQPLSAVQTRALAQQLMGADAAQHAIDTLCDYDGAWSAPGIGRVRVNILRQRATHAIVLRIVSETVPTFASLDLPASLGALAQMERGMVLVTGVTGSGKSSTMAALVGAINATQEKHIVTLENPIEFLHSDLKSSVTQREIGLDTESFRVGLRAALRQDPDVILIGELRDAETVDTALKAAETGHLLISTLHTPDAQTTVSRMVAMFPGDVQATARLRLADALQAVVSQRLLPRASGRGRVAAVEIMIVTPTIRDLIAENRVEEIREFMTDGANYGMQTFDQHLTTLVRAGEVTYEVALAAATRPADFALQFRLNRMGATPSYGSARRGAPGDADAPAEPSDSGAPESGVAGQSSGFEHLFPS